MEVVDVAVGATAGCVGADFAAANSFCNLSLSAITSTSFASRLFTLASESCNFVSALGEDGLAAFVEFESVSVEHCEAGKIFRRRS